MEKIFSKKIKWNKCFLNIYLNKNNQKYTAKVEGSKFFNVFENKYFEQDCEALDVAEVLLFKRKCWFIKY